MGRGDPVCSPVLSESGLAGGLTVSGGGERVDLVEKDDCGPHLGARVEACRQLLLRLAVPFGHDALERQAHKRPAKLLGQDAGC